MTARTRFTLERTVDPFVPTTALWIMLNPSTADEFVDDPTIRRVKAFTAREGFGRLVVVNLAPWRATDPKSLPLVVQQVGESEEARVNARNYAVIAEQIASADVVIAAWGAHATPQLRRIVAMWAMPSPWPAGWPPIRCLGRTQSGAPRHPLYVRGDVPLVEFVEAHHARQAGES